MILTWPSSLTRDNNYLNEWYYIYVFIKVDFHQLNIPIYTVFYFTYNTLCKFLMHMYICRIHMCQPWNNGNVSMFHMYVCLR